MTSADDPNQVGGESSLAVGHAELVHEARKAVKRMRALARLLRNELGEQEFKRVNGSLRAAGRRLGGARDAEVRLGTLRRLVGRHPKALALEGVKRLGEQLEHERTLQSPHRQGVLEDIADMRHELARWNLVDLGFPALEPGLKRIYREGRHRHSLVKRVQARDAEHLHDWRKRVKSLYYALDMLGAAKAKGGRRATRRASRLGDLLGEEHDLWMLAAYIEERPSAAGEDAAAHERLLKLIARRRKRLRKRALKLGAALYEPRAGDFARRIGHSLAN